MKPVLFLVAAAVAFAAPASAAWVAYERTPTSEELFDPVVVSREQSQVTLWTLSNFPAPMTSLEARQYSSEKVLTTIDCVARKSGASQVLRYSGLNATGELVGRMETDLRLTPVRPGSTDEVLVQEICR